MTIPLCGDKNNWAKPIRVKLTRSLINRLPAGAYVASNTLAFAERLGPANSRAATWTRIKATRADDRLCWACWLLDGGEAPGLTGKEELGANDVVAMCLELLSKVGEVGRPSDTVQDVGPELNG